ncbi:MAG TPA: 4Fe-4S binding protein [bacterium]|jgi:MinD superfamily P-loop ATPase|nr:4Fe-4S binding protein [bacterium]HNW15713.1 4Fe-4S binding protein [bacterium]HNZ54022.1 4Fe-4S binding protein [bacterium]HOB72594.1 4Fe-4S binding protein [bacterium]HOG44414.1 4Fe-4S binding protein [bacterium]
MKEIVVISGKGGTGKTSIASSLFALSQNSIAADCDVDAADMFIVLEPEIVRKSDFYSGRVAVIDNNKCTNCGVCRELCRFDSISVRSGVHFIDGNECEGCKVCVEFCPEKAIDFIDRLCGEWFFSETRFGPLVHAKLGIGAENSGKLVTLVRNEAKRIAVEKKSDFIIVDGPPGIGCPVIASVTGADAVLIVTEPTLSGFHDLKRVMSLAKHFRIKTAVVVNRWDVNSEMTDNIEEYVHGEGASFIGRVSYSSDFTDAQILKKTVVEYKNGMTYEEIHSIWKKLLKFVNGEEK